MHKYSKSNHSERGQSMVELALTFVLLMILLAGTIDLGRAFFTWLAMRDAAQEGASYGSLKPADTAGLQARVWDNLEQVVNSPSTTIVVSPTISGSSCMGNIIQVDVEYPNFPLSMPFLGTILGSQTIPIRASVNDTILNPPCP